MGNYILCGQPAAEIPYHIDSISLNLYSLQELCYFIANYIPMADESVICEKLTDWLEQECSLPGTAELVRSFLNRENGTFEAIKLILKSAHYYSAAQLEKILAKLEEYNSKREPERKKMRADLLMSQKKYRNAIEEYRKILDMTGIISEQKDFRAKVYYNLGSAYARMFRLGSAKTCFSRSYDLQKEEKVKRALLAAAYLEGGKTALETEAARVGADEGEVNTFLLEIRSVDTPKVEENVSELAERWISEYHENTGL